MSANMVWIIECNHEPLVRDGQVVSFSSGREGTNSAREYLNRFPETSEDSENYYDAVLYRSRMGRKA